MVRALPPGAPTRFDLTLLLMGVALAAGAVVGWLSWVPARLAGAGAAAVAGVVMADGLVRNPPGR